MGSIMQTLSRGQSGYFDCIICGEKTRRHSRTQKTCYKESCKVEMRHQQVKNQRLRNS